MKQKPGTVNIPKRGVVRPKTMNAPSRTYGEYPETMVAVIDGDPSELAATGGETTIDLEWTNGSTNEDGILVERSLDSIEWAGLDTIAAEETTYSDATAEAATTYYYRVTAFAGHSFSEKSNVASAALV